MKKGNINIVLALLGVLGALVVALMVLEPLMNPTGVTLETPDGVQRTDTVAFDVLDHFIASGFMGDLALGTRYVELIERWSENPHSAPFCVKVRYSLGPMGWAGLYWQNRANNWGDFLGENFKQSNYTKLTFWARGENGRETVEFKAGGMMASGKRYQDSFAVTTGRIVLNKEWKQYTIDLGEADLSNVIGGFSWVTSGSLNPRGLIFYVDDVRYE